MVYTPDLDREWKLVDVIDTLWAEGISLKPQAGGYRLNFRSGGTAATEFITDDLIEALTTGLAMSETLPSTPVVRPGVRRPRQKYSIGRSGAIRQRRRRGHRK